MAPNYPEEVDVFTVPHSRMKQLVHTYLDLVSSTNFRNVGHMTSVLEKLCHTFHVFKTHEQIENRFIMRRLKEKLTALDITDTAVCNCHSDNRLTEMLSMVLDGYRWAQRGERERVKYGLRLRHALEDFTQVFIPHMKEEEEVFQPMLIEYFTYDELKELKAKVIQQHLQKMDDTSQDEKYVPECDSDKEEEEGGACSAVEQLPTEVMMNIFSYLSPQDLCRCAQVSHRFQQLAMDPSLWRTIHPVQWAAGDWSFYPREEGEEEEEGVLECGGEEEDYCYVDDEDADRDESSDSESSVTQEDDNLKKALREVRVVSGLVRHVLPRVGTGVEYVNLVHSRGISSSLVHKILKLCPNLRVLKLAHTKITDAAFKEYGVKGGVGKLEHLDLTGCENITDSTLHSLAGKKPALEESHVTSVQTCGEKSYPLTTSRPCCEKSHQLTTLRTCSEDTNHLSSTQPCGEESHLTSPCGKESCHDSTQRQGEEESHYVTTSPRGEESPHITTWRLLEDRGQDNVTAALVSLTVSVNELSSDDPVIEADPSFTDLPVDLCPLDIEGTTAPACLIAVPGGPSRFVPGCPLVRTCCSSGDSGCGREGGREEGEKDREPHALHRLSHLSLNGCYRITDDGIRTLADRGGLPRLQYLDLSGCVSLTGDSVAWLVDTCISLDHALLFYCDNVLPDPFPTTASGCRNLQCSARFCCRSGE